MHLQAQRALLFERFRDSWQAEASKGTWAKLVRNAEEALAELSQEQAAASAARAAPTREKFPVS